MEVLINSKNNVDHEIEIIVPTGDLQPHFDKAYREEAKNIVIPGFRRGKVPMQIIRKRFGSAIEYQVIEKLSNEFFKEALEERDIQPVGQPVLLDMDYKPGEQLLIKVQYETAPEVLAKDYKGLQLERLTHEITEEELDEEMENLRKSQRSLEACEKADDEDFLVTIEIQMLDENGAPIAGQYNENMKVELNDENMNRDLKAELLNMKAGEEKDVEFSHEHGDHEHTERAHVKVKSIERIILPVLDDEFAKTASNGEAEDVAALRELMRSKLDEAWQQRYRSQLEQELVNAVIKANPMDVPKSIVEHILDDWQEQLKERYPNRELPADFNAEEYRKARRPEAEASAKWMYLRENIVEQEKIEINDDDMRARAEKDSASIGIDVDRLLEFYKSSPQFSEGVMAGKVVDLLLEHAEIKEVDDNDMSNTGMEPLQFHASEDGADAPAAAVETETPAADVDSENDTTDEEAKEG